MIYFDRNCTRNSGFFNLNILEELDIQELENMIPSSFAENEQKWLNDAMEYYMKQEKMK